MADAYESLSKEALIEILRRRDAQARYGLQWERRDIAPDQALNRDFVGLSIEPDLCAGPAPWSNLVIEGDNYDALRVLATHYAGRFKLIYIDPPYNTGRKDFVYNDRFLEPTDRFRHSTWLEFMYQRLLLARDLLAPDGAIFVSIDDNEVFNLGLLMNRVFGEQNHVANVIWQKVFAPKNTAQHFSDDHEYILVYAADKQKWRPNHVPRSARQDAAYKNPDNDPRGPWTSGDLAARNPYSEGRYPITCPSGRVIDGPPAGSYWRVSRSKFDDLDRDGRIWWGKDGNNTPRIKRFLSEVKQGVVPQTLWTFGEVGHTQDAKKDLAEYLPMDRNRDVFSTPKPVALMRRILEIGSSPGDLTLDYFGGSGTWGEAVARLNAETSPPRRFVLVSNSEATSETPERNICRDFCALRVRRAVEGFTRPDGRVIQPLGGGFAYAVASRVPFHRLDDALTDEIVWSHALLASDHPLFPYPGGTLSTSEHAGHVIHYLKTATAASLLNLKAVLAARPGPATVYTWAVSKVEAALAGVTGVAIISLPEALAAGFRRGHAESLEHAGGAMPISEAISTLEESNNRVEVVA